MPGQTDVSSYTSHQRLRPIERKDPSAIELVSFSFDTEALNRCLNFVKIYRLRKLIPLRKLFKTLSGGKESLKALSRVASSTNTLFKLSKSARMNRAALSKRLVKPY
jgi:hypothetical protein